MKIRIYRLYFVLIILIFCIINLTFVYANFVGEGLKENPFLLKNKEDIYSLSKDVNSGIDYAGKYFKMTNDIELDKSFISIGCLKDKSKDEQGGANINPFSGIFDGDNHIMTFEKFSKPLFSFCRDAEVKNLNIKGTYIDGFALVDNYVMDFGKTGKGMNNAKEVVRINNVNLLDKLKVKKGGYIGIDKNYKFGITSNNKILIENCTINKGVILGLNINEDLNIIDECDNYSREQLNELTKNLKFDNDKCASFASEFIGTIKNCKSYALIYGEDYVGGIAAVQSNAMGDCNLIGNEFYGNIIANGKYVGGILGAGFNKNGSAPNAGNVIVNDNIVDNECNISGEDFVGGIVGNVNTVQNWSNAPLEIKNNKFYGRLKCVEKNKGLIIGKLRSINKYCHIEKNVALNNEENKKVLPFGYVEYVDTNSSDLKEQSGLIYIDTSKKMDLLPKIPIDDYGYMEWRENHNRNDSPLFKDIAKLFNYVDKLDSINERNYSDIKKTDNIVLECELLDSNFEISYKENITPLSLLELAKLKVYTRATMYGKYIYKINDKEEKTGPFHGAGWVYYINGEFASVACDKYKCKKNDVITWKYISW